MIDDALKAGATVVDTRPAKAFVAKALPGTLSIPANRSFTTWAGSLLSYDREFFLLVDERAGQGIDTLARALAGIGLDRIAGYADAGTIDARPADRLQTITAMGLAELTGAAASGAVTLLDVRSRAEWSAGHLPGAVNIPLGELEACLSTLPRGRPIVVHCQTGARAAIAASLLSARDVKDVRLFGGGFAEWRDAKQAVEVSP